MNDPHRRPQSRRLIDAAAALYLPAGRSAYHFARGKLAHDPIFLELLRRGAFADGDHVLDLGCGQAALFALLVAARMQAEADEWPDDWPVPPATLALHGIDQHARDVRAANIALADRATVIEGDLREAVLPDSDVVVLLDVLHYLDASSQEHLLARVADALHADSTLLLRVGDAASQLRFSLTHAVDRLVLFARGYRDTRLHGRSVDEWIALLGRLGFSVQAEPMSRGTPFANFLLTARK